MEQRILAYLDNELTAEELRTFEAEMAENQELAKEVKRYQNMELLLKHEAALRLEKKRQAEDSAKRIKERIKASRKIPIWRSPLALAASFFLLVGLAWWLLTPSISMNLPKEIYGSEAAREQAGEDDYVALVQYAKDTVNAKEEGLQKNIAEFRRIQASFGKENGARYDTVQLMGADLELKVKEYEKALAYLEKVTNVADNKMQALVYQRFTYVYYLQKNCEKAKPAVEKWQALAPNDAQLKQAQKAIAKQCK
ncbi:MAG: hypothetical protein ACKVTZ_09480 [Bacteroidia bacterium]